MPDRGFLFLAAKTDNASAIGHSRNRSHPLRLHIRSVAQFPRALPWAIECCRVAATPAAPRGDLCRRPQAWACVTDRTLPTPMAAQRADLRQDWDPDLNAPAPAAQWAVLR